MFSHSKTERETYIPTLETHGTDKREKSRWKQ